METHQAPFVFDPSALYSPTSAAAHVRRKSPSGRSPIGPLFFRRAHADGRLAALDRNGRLVFTGADLNRLLGETFEVPESPEARGARRAAEQIRRDAALEPARAES